MIDEQEEYEETYIKFNITPIFIFGSIVNMDFPSYQILFGSWNAVEEVVVAVKQEKSRAGFQRDDSFGSLLSVGDNDALPSFISAGYASATTPHLFPPASLLHSPPNPRRPVLPAVPALPVLPALLPWEDFPNNQQGFIAKVEEIKAKGRPSTAPPSPTTSYQSPLCTRRRRSSLVLPKEKTFGHHYSG